jgi:archaellum biogenesis protein FlaJ (TadC family)
VNLLAASLFVFVLMAIAGVLIISHVVSWQRYQQAPKEKIETDYRARQYRRRMQVSAMLVAAAVAMLIGVLISWRDWPSVFVLWWTGVVVLVGWIILLAMADALETRRFFRRVHHDRARDQVRWQAEFDRRKAERRKAKG